MGKGSNVNSNEEEKLRTFTWDEIHQHKDRGNRWIVINGGVYDITQWQHKHPGGAKILGHYAGENATVRVTDKHEILLN